MILLYLVITSIVGLEAFVLIMVTNAFVRLLASVNESSNFLKRSV